MLQSKFTRKRTGTFKKCVSKKNGYPLWMVNQVMETVKQTINTENSSKNQLDIS